MQISELKIREIIIGTFPDAVVPANTADLKLGDFPEWDSMGNFNLILELESNLDIRFSVDETSSMKSVADFIDAISKK